MQLHFEYVYCKEERYTGDKPTQAYKCHMASSDVKYSFNWLLFLYEQKYATVYPPI